MMFYYAHKTGNVNKNFTYRGMIIDSPGYGYTYAPVKIKREWQKLHNGYLSHAVRLNLARSPDQIESQVPLEYQQRDQPSPMLYHLKLGRR